SCAVALEAVRDEAGLGRTVAQVRSERERLTAQLRGHGWRVLPSEANFILARSSRSVWLRDALAGLGIAVRDFPGNEHLADALRITCPANETDFARLTHAIDAALAPEAVLLDLDGVLADVSRSYRRAIVETAAAYGVEITAQDIARAKALGNANNDWILTQRLLAQRGIDRPLAEVTERFERIYQGTDDNPGLRMTETLIGDRAALERLRARTRLAIVTGRPRFDAQRFLEEQGIADCFEQVIALEDGPSKPDPAPVRCALERMGVSRAWMVGDTPDDMRSARAAGVVPVGIPAPNDTREEAERTLFASGAARVLRSLDELLEVLPS
ncbi:MAG: TIGR01548 family HAD-type hydrolase, partial [Phycisphaeraceae bacterium]